MFYVGVLICLFVDLLICFHLKISRQASIENRRSQINKSSNHQINNPI